MKEGDIIQNRVIRPGRMWVEGDNKENENDSRLFGDIPISLIEKKVSFKVCKENIKINQHH